MATSDALMVPWLDVRVDHLLPLTVLGIYLSAVVQLLKFALDTVKAAGPKTPPPTEEEARRRSKLWTTIFKVIGSCSLLHTWLHMMRYMRWSYENVARTLPTDPEPSDLFVIGTWLRQTSLFEEAWAIVLRPGVPAWISEHITHYTIGFWALFVWAYTRPNNGGGGSTGRLAQRWGNATGALFLLMGQLVAISVSAALFCAACAHRGLGQLEMTSLRVPLGVWAPLLASSSLSALVPWTIDESTFLPNLLFFHLLLFIPFLPIVQRPTATLSIRTTLILLVIPTLPTILHSPPSPTAVWLAYQDGNEALRSISADALWTLVGAAAWAVYKGRSLTALAVGPAVYWLTGSPLGFNIGV